MGFTSGSCFLDELGEDRGGVGGLDFSCLDCLDFSCTLLVLLFGVDADAAVLWCASS